MINYNFKDEEFYKQIKFLRLIFLIKTDQVFDKIPYLNRNDFYIAGGSLVSLFNGEEVKDYDFYYKCPPKITYNPSIGQIQQYNPQLFEMREETLKQFGTTKPKAETYQAYNLLIEGNKIQFIKSPFYGDPKNVVKTFDFLHCMLYYDCETEIISLSRKTFECIKNKKLVLNPNYTRKLDQKRVKKYLNRGFNW